MTEKELEKLFRKKFDERSFEFNPAAWTGAEKLIVEGEKRRRRRVIFGWSAAATVLLMGGFMTYNILTMPDVNGEKDLIAWPSQEQELILQSEESTIASESSFEDATSGDTEGSEIIPSSTSASTSSVDHSMATSPSSQSAVATAPSSDLAEVRDDWRRSENGIEIVVLSMDRITLRPTQPTLDPVPALMNSEEEESESNAEESEVLASSNENAANPIISRPKQIVQPWTLGLEGGFNISQMNGGSRGFVPALYGGLSLGYQFAESWTFQSGLIYARRSNYGTRQDKTSRSYGFGSRLIELEVTASTVDYLEIPLVLNYGLGRHNVSFGGYAAIKTLSNARVTRTVTETLAGSESTSYVAQGYEDNSATMDFGLSLGYSFALSDRWMLSANGMMGLADGYQMQSSGLNNHIQIRLGAKYLLWR